MSRKVPYVVIPRHCNPGDKESEIKYYACIKSSGDVTINEMAERMSLESTLTKADIVAVLASLENVIADSLRRGEIIRLADLGSFSISLHSEGVNAEKIFSSGLIKGASLKFRPGKALKSCLQTLDYSKVKAETDSEDASQDEAPSVE